MDFIKKEKETTKKRGKNGPRISCVEADISEGKK